MSRKETTTYTFDMTAVVTIRVTTGAGVDAARKAAGALSSISVAATGNDLEVGADVAPGTRYDVTYVSPRGRGYLVEAENSDGTETGISGMESFPEPITEADRDALLDVMNTGITALEGDSNDSEHEALWGLTETVAALLGKKFSPDI